jgi:hypothetical protein
MIQKDAMPIGGSHLKITVSSRFRVLAEHLRRTERPAHSSGGLNAASAQNS